MLENNVFTLEHSEFEVSFKYPNEECLTTSWI